MWPLRDDALAHLTVENVPFRHVVIDEAFEELVAREVFFEWPDHDNPRWKRYANERERKNEGSDPAMWSDAMRLVMETFARPAFCTLLARVFGFGTLEFPTELVADGWGGGYHEIEEGGLLALHADFNVHPELGLQRKLNCLWFLNEGWQYGDGGTLELWGPKFGHLIEPMWNRLVIFETSSTSWHGHPDPWKRSTPRRSVACYYYDATPPPADLAAHSTVWKADGAS